MTHWARRNLVGAWCPAVSGSDGFLLRDLSGNGNHGTLTNMDPATDWVTSNGYQALDFDGVNDFFTATISNRPISTSQSISVVIWNEQTSYAIGSGGAQRTLFSYGGSTNNMMFASTNTSATYNGSFTCGSAFTYVVKLLTMPQVGEIACLVMVYDGVSISGYLNGSLQGVDTSGTMAAWVNGVFVIGYSGASQYNASRVFDARIYHSALTASEVQQLYHGGPGYGLRPERRRKYYFATSSTVIPRFVHHYRQQGAA